MACSTASISVQEFCTCSWRDRIASGAKCWQAFGPVWDGNKVWLLAAGGTLYFVFPALYASGFSGFYLPLMIVLWLLILRGISIEFRSHIHSLVWDAVFCCSSLLLAVLYGAALGNVVRGVPLDAQGYFFEPLWTNFRLGAELASPIGTPSSII
jgi:cytochrome d ubiquinol oxidase subunit II